MSTSCFLRGIGFIFAFVFVSAGVTTVYAELINAQYDNTVGLVNNATSINGLPQNYSVEITGSLGFPGSLNKTVSDNGGFNPNIVASYYLTSSSFQFNATQSATTTTFDWSYSERAVDGAHSLGYGYYGANNRMGASFSITGSPGSPATYTITDISSLQLTNLTLELLDYNVQTQQLTTQYLELYGVGTTTNLSDTFTGTLLPGHGYSIVAATGLESNVGHNVVSSGDINVTIQSGGPASVPEPSSILLLTVGAIGAAIVGGCQKHAKRRRHNEFRALMN